MRTTVSLPSALLENAKAQAATRGATLSALVEEGLRIVLAAPPAAAAPAFKLRTVRGRLVDPGLDLDRTSALIAAEDERQFARRRG